MKDEMRKYFPDRFKDSTWREFGLSSSLPYNSIYRRKARCESLVMETVKRSDEIRLLAGAMKKHGCNFDLSRHVSCERCIDCHGGYDPDTNQIVVCENTQLTKNRILSTMMHEMIHMFDFCRAQFDFNNLDHVACSEIRAANLTYCSLVDKFSHPGGSLFALAKSHQNCVKEVAVKSVQAYSPETEVSKIVDIVERIFPGCYNDLEPFGRRAVNGERQLKQSYRERYYYGYLY